MNLIRLTILGTLLPVAAFAQNLLQNPSFEAVQISIGGGNYTPSTAANIDLSGAAYSPLSYGNLDNWAFLGNGHLAGTASYDSTVEGTAEDGSRFVNFGGPTGNYPNGYVAGNDIFQSFSTQTGQTYTVSFYARYYGTGTTSTNLSLRAEAINVDTAGTLLRFDLAPGGTHDLTSTWTQYSFNFVAGSINSRIYFRDKTLSTNGTDLDIQLDNASVTVAAVPESAASPLLFAVAGLMFASWSRRRSV